MSPELGFRASNIENNKSNLSGRVKDASDFAKKAHEGQVRKSNEPYFTHCEAVYKILKEEWGIENEDCLIAALLHDTVEDTKVTLEEIKEEFGEDVAKLVSGVTNLKSSNDRENLKKILNEGYIDPRVAIIKLADRLHNMRTIKFMEPAKQIEKAKETLEVFTKLAESLGIWSAKTELEDLCFEILYPEKYQETKDELKADERSNSVFVSELKEKMEKLVFCNYIHGKVDIKKSGLWTLTKKQEKRAQEGKGSSKSFKDVDDVVSVRIQLNTKEECRIILGKIEDKYGKDIDQERSDNFFGNNKRVNGYQALHVTVNFPQGPVKIAIMTEEMEAFNKWGVINLINSKNEEKIKDHSLKIVFTPNGSCLFLPKNATIPDFLGSLGLEFLSKTKFVYIDGEEKQTTEFLPNASEADIIFGNKATIEELKEMKKSATMPQTEKMIDQLINLVEKNILIKQGKEKLESILIPRGLLVLTDLKKKRKNKFLKKFEYEGINNFYFKIGNGSIEEGSIKKALDLAKITKEKLKITSIRLKGLDEPNVLENVTRLISDNNNKDKNIIRTSQKNKKNYFNIRIVVENMSRDEEDKLRNYLLNDKRFSEVLVV